MAEAEADISARLLASFEAAGAERIEPGYLQPADILLDLYGETIRSRAYTTSDPVHGEQMLRPDFTVPVVRQHMAAGRTQARYCYAGPVWRRQAYGSTRAREFWQVGFEILDDGSPAEADAEVFARMAEALAGQGAEPITGDLSILFAAIGGLPISDAKKRALRRHVWRPKRFDRLMNRFTGLAPFAADRLDLPEDVNAAMDAAGPRIGMRSGADVQERIAALGVAREDGPMRLEDMALLQGALSLCGKARACLGGVRALARECAPLGPVADRLEARLDAMDRRGIDTAALDFDARFGRDTMEYYDGFVFAFRRAGGDVDLASGGRYDALTRVLGQGNGIAAVGGVLRPGQWLNGEARP